ncbi:MAG: hypothetical protein KGD65_08290 [Candidatus Lokiarchaeota archaeon]|nr:hypothetical protein [Candidatus Lokiarchaeota archaeon]
MSQNIINIFKLNFDGSFDEIAYENVKEVFTIVNILAIYITSKKIMYIWIGSNATQALKNHISNIRVLVKEEFPDFRIIRNFTFEMREEPFDFFKNLDLSKEELYKLIDYQEKVMLPTLRKIEHLKLTTGKLVDSEDYPNAVKTTEEIIKLAIEINDDALLTEQNRLITELKTRSADKVIIDKIEDEVKQLDQQFSDLIATEEFLKAHRIVEEFEKKNSKIHDLSTITSARELISKEKKIWKREQERLIKELTKLENDLFLAIKNLEIEKAINIMEKGKSNFSNLINDEVKKKWDHFEEDLQEAKQKAELIKSIDIFIVKSEEMNKDYQFSPLKKEINGFLTRVQKLDIHNYQKKLEDLKSKIISAEEDYNKKIAEIENLEKSINKNQESNLMDDVLRDCQKIIQVAQTLNKSTTLEKYSIILEQTEKSIEERKIFEEKQKKLVLELKQLEGKLNSLLKDLDIPKLEKIVEKSKILLIELVNEEIKENWIVLEKKYKSARELLENVEKLGKSGLSALDDRSYRESLRCYEQIINQIKIYSK